MSVAALARCSLDGRPRNGDLRPPDNVVRGQLEAGVPVSRPSQDDAAQLRHCREAADALGSSD